MVECVHNELPAIENVSWEIVSLPSPQFLTEYTSWQSKAIKHQSPSRNNSTRTKVLIRIVLWQNVSKGHLPAWKSPSLRGSLKNCIAKQSLYRSFCSYYIQFEVHIFFLKVYCSACSSQLKMDNLFSLTFSTFYEILHFCCGLFLFPGHTQWCSGWLLGLCSEITLDGFRRPYGMPGDSKGFCILSWTHVFFSVLLSWFLNKTIARCFSWIISLEFLFSFLATKVFVRE